MKCCVCAYTKSVWGFLVGELKFFSRFMHGYVYTYKDKSQFVYIVFVMHFFVLIKFNAVILYA